MFPERLIDYGDIARGVVDLGADLARTAFRAVFRMPREGLSSHFVHESEPEDTLASHPRLFTPDWVTEHRFDSPVYADPTHHVDERQRVED